jgi:hypothetical protein
LSFFVNKKRKEDDRVKESGKVPEIRAMRDVEFERVNLVLEEKRPDCWEGKIKMLQENRPYPLLWRKWVLFQFSVAIGCKNGGMINLESMTDDCSSLQRRYARYSLHSSL